MTPPVTALDDGTGRPEHAEESSGVIAQGVVRRFGDVAALRGVDLVAPPGEVTALVGSNGAGKTTLLLVLATLLVPDDGTVRIDGLDPTEDTAAVRGRLGWAPDAFGVYESVTAREYLEFSAATYRLRDGRERARRLLATARLEEYADAPVHVLSRGQKQRLGLARALVHDPSVLLLDEPASGLDPRARVELRDRLRSLAAEGCTVLVSSHVLADLEEVADGVVVVDRGVTVAQQRMADVGRADAATPGGERPSRRWRLRALDASALVAALQRRGVASAPAGAAGVDVALADEEEAAELLAALVHDGVRVTTCTPVGGALEAAFLQWTSGPEGGQQ